MLTQMAALDTAQQQLLATLRDRLQAPDGEVQRDLVQGGEVLDDACLRRWLRADKWEVDRAEQRLRDHAKWRVGMAPNGRIDEVQTSRMHWSNPGPRAAMLVPRPASHRL